MINKLDSHFVVLLPLLIHHLSDILFSVTSGLHSVNDIIIADPVSTDTSLTSTTCQGTYPNIVLSCKIISLWIVCNKDLKQTTMATATKAWPNKRFNEDTSSSVCMFKILFISFPSSETQQHKSPKFAWGKNRNSDGKLFTSV